MIHSCKKCAKRKHCIYKPTSEVADCGYFVRDTQKPKQTNYDRIHAMSVEELAEFLLKVNAAHEEPCMTDGGDCKWKDYLTYDKGCKDCFSEWLKSEVKK